MVGGRVCGCADHPCCGVLGRKGPTGPCYVPHTSQTLGYLPGTHWFRYFSTAFPGGSVVKKKKSACNAGDPGSVPRLGRSSRERHGNPLQYSCLENPMDRGAWQATVHGRLQSQSPGGLQSQKSDMTDWLIQHSLQMVSVQHWFLTEAPDRWVCLSSVPEHPPS